jgi:hypothetical protein
VITHLNCTREGPGSNLDLETHYPKFYSWFLQFNSGIILRIMPRPLPSSSLHICYSVLLSHSVLYCLELLKQICRNYESSVRAFSYFLLQFGWSTCYPTKCYVSTYLSMALKPFVGPWPLFGFLIFYTAGGNPWTGDQPVARSLLKHRYACIESDSNPRS